MSVGQDNDLARRVIAEAGSWVGTPYRDQGRRRGVGCDCLGLVLGVYGTIYGFVPDTTRTYSPDWAEAGGEDVLLDGARRFLLERAVGDAVPGDVLIFRWRPHLPAKHAGILIELDHFIHAYRGAGVTLSPLSHHWRRRIAAAFAFPDRPRND